MQILFKTSNTGGNTATLGNSNFLEHYSSVNPATAWKLFEPTIRKVTERKLIPYISQELYDDLAAAYLADEIQDGAQEDFLTLCQDVVALYAMLELGPEFNISFGPMGAVEKGSNVAPVMPIAQWRYHEWKYDIAKKADQALDLLILRLDKYVKDEITYFDLWKDSPQYNLLRTAFFTSAGEYNRYVKINNSRRLFEALVPQIELIEDEVRSLICDTQFNNLKQAILDDDLTDLEVELVDKIRKFVATKAVSASVSSLFLNLDGHGLTLSSFTDGMQSNGHHGASFRGAEAVSRYIVDLDIQSQKHFKILMSFIHDNIDDLTDIQESDCYKSYTSESRYPICTGAGGVMI